MDFLHGPVTLEFPDELLHVAIKLLLAEHILERERAAGPDHTQGLPDNIPLVSGRADFMEDKIAHGPVKACVGKIKFCRVAFLKDNPIRNTLERGVFLTLLFGVAPFGAPVIHSDQLCIRVCFRYAVCEGGLFEKFVGKTADEIRAMDMTGADAVSGATMVSAAAQEAVLNALEGKAGKTFLEVEGTALTAESIEGNTVTLASHLPDDFDLELLDIRWSVYNDEIVPEDSYSVQIADGKMEIVFDDIMALKPGYYYVNVIDASGKYRSPSFEGGPGAAQAAYFVIDSGLAEGDVSFDGTAVVLSSGEIADYLKNIEHVQILAEGAEEPAEQAPVGHHGTAGSFIALDENGVLAADGVVKARDGSESPLFEDGTAYTVTIAAFGYPELTFDFEKGAAEQ